MTGYVATYRVDDNPNWSGPGVETIELPVIMVKFYGNNDPVPCVLGHLGQVYQVDSLYVHAGRPVRLISVRPA